MALPVIIMAASAAAGVAATAIGAAMAQGDYEKARQLRQQYADQYGDAMVPHLDKAVAQEVGPTALASIQEDAKLRGTQTEAIGKLRDLYESGGMTPQDEAALQLANEGAQQQSASDYASVQQSLAARGQQLNPAMAAALASKASGDVVHATAQNRYRAQADARERAMRALGASADLAGRVREDDYGHAANAASAADRINQFNAGQRTNAQLQNAQLTQQEFDDLMRVRGAKTNAGMGVADTYDAQGNRTRQTAAGIGAGITSIGAGVAGYNADGSKKRPGEA